LQDTLCALQGCSALHGECGGHGCGFLFHSSLPRKYSSIADTLEYSTKRYAGQIVSGILMYIFDLLTVFDFPFFRASSLDHFSNRSAISP
jgi:hypothetical protein